MDNNSNNIIAIIQARMGSTRLPGKVLMKINGVPLLELMLSRVKKSELLNKIVIATSTDSKDDKIVNFCKKHNYEYFRGSENDVLSRYYKCAKLFNVDVIVRLTADCPLIDPVIIDDVVKLYTKSAVDYAANTVPPEKSRYPDGSDVEVFSFEALEKGFFRAKKDSEREHVTHYFWRSDNGFKIAQLSQKNDWSKYRFTLDYPEDFEVIKFIIEELDRRNSFGLLSEIIEIIEGNPEIKEKNSKYYFGIGVLDKKE